MRTRALQAVAPDDLEVPVVSTSPPKRRRPWWLVVGVSMVVLAALLGAYVVAAVTEEMSVMVAARDLEPGRAVTEADLRVVEMGQAGGLRAVQPHQQDLIVGLVPRAPIPAGTVLNTDLFVAMDEAVPLGMVVVGASLEAGAVPTPGLGPGDDVVLVEVTASNPGATPAGSGVVLGEASVWTVTASAESTGASSQVWVSLLVAESLQTSVAQAAADGRLRLSLSGL